MVGNIKTSRVSKASYESCQHEARKYWELYLQVGNIKFVLALSSVFKSFGRDMTVSCCSYCAQKKKKDEFGREISILTHWLGTGEASVVFQWNYFYKLELNWMALKLTPLGDQFKGSFKMSTFGTAMWFTIIFGKKWGISKNKFC